MSRKVKLNKCTVSYPEPPMREDVWDAVVEHVRRGLSLTRACAMVGADVRQVKRVAKAQPRLGRQLAGAKAHLIADLTDVVVEAATGEDGDWRAATWLLGKMEPAFQERKRPTVQITNNVLNAGDRKELEGATDADLHKMLGFSK